MKINDKKILAEVTEGLDLKRHKKYEILSMTKVGGGEKSMKILMNIYGLKFLSRWTSREVQTRIELSGSLI